MKKISALVFILITVCGLSFCGSSKKTIDPEVTLYRSFYMGFTTWPYAATVDGVADVFNRAKSSSYGDIVALHYMDGVPWTTADTTLYRPEDLATVYSASLKNYITEKIISTAPASAIYLAIDPINSDRSGINKTYESTVPSITFDSTQAKYSYVNYAVYAMYEIYTYYTANGYALPKIYFNYGTEASELILKGFNSTTGTFDMTQWNAFVNFSNFVYTSLNVYTAPYAGTPSYNEASFIAFISSSTLMVSVAMKSPEDATAGNIVVANALTDPSEKLRESFAGILPYIDMAGVSTYGYIFYDGQYGAITPDTLRADPARLPVNWLSQISLIAPGKPSAITETGWISEDYDVRMDTSYIITSDQTRQNDYISKMLTEADQLEMEFVIVFSLADYHPLWNTFDAAAKLASLTWLSTGLFEVTPESGTGPFTLTSKTSWTTWQSWLGRTLQ